MSQKQKALTQAQHEFLMSKSHHVDYAVIGKRHATARSLENRGLVVISQGLFAYFTDEGMKYVRQHLPTE